CPCGSGKKYKNCCYPKRYKEVLPQKKNINLTLDDGSKIQRPVITIDSIPKHNKNGISPNLTDIQIIDLCLDEVFKLVKSEKVGMLVDLVNKVVLEMDIIPPFTYKQIAERMKIDGRFEIYQYQICSLKGTNPIELMANKLNI
ncbi:MAG TPA: SEC-C domain-containing protein, partial [Flavobacteriaceae bacterium]|nr:SEC-C domain-containing protein [Flavobacteriaceae bacterium]